MRSAAHSISLGGILAALAVVLMSLGGLIPIATYVCPMLCMILLLVVIVSTNTRIAWAWYIAVALLSVLLSPDKEAAGVFVALGYYPMIRPKLESLPGKWLWKLLLFNGAILSLYAIFMYVISMQELLTEFTELGIIGSAFTLVLGNVCFLLLDLTIKQFYRKLVYKLKKQ